MMVSCLTCGTDLEPLDRACSGCGAPRVEDARLEGEATDKKAAARPP